MTIQAQHCQSFDSQHNQGRSEGKAIYVFDVKWYRGRHVKLTFFYSNCIWICVGCIERSVVRLRSFTLESELYLGWSALRKSENKRPLFRSIEAKTCL